MNFLTRTPLSRRTFLHGVGAAIAPVAASAATTTTSAVGDRVSSIKSALAGLVTDATLTQAQADKVATTVDATLPEGGHGGYGHGADLATAATALGVTEDALRTQLEAGKTLAQVAQTKGISQATLVTKLVAAQKTRIAAAVEAGTLTQAQADARTADLTSRITQQVTSTRALGGHGRGDRAGGTGTTPGATPSPSSTTS